MFGKRSKSDLTPDDASFQDEFSAEAAEAGFEPEEGWDSGDTFGADQDDEKAQKSSGSPLVRVLPWAALGIVGAVAVGYVYLGKQPAPTAEPVVAPIAATAPEGQPTLPTPTPTGEVASAPVVTPTEETAVPQPTPVAEIPQPDLAATATPALPESTATPATSLPQPIETSPITAQPEPNAAMGETVLAQQSASETAPQPVAIPDAPAQEVPLEAPITAAPPPTATAPAAVTAATDIPAPVAAQSTQDQTQLAAEVKRLQDELAQLKAQSQETPAVVETPAAPAPVAKAEKPTAPKPTATTQRRPSTPAAKAPAKAAPVATSWVLRAAQDGEAWISRGENGELKRVTAGETVNGLGKITTIQQAADGKWEVVGSQTTVRQ